MAVPAADREAILSMLGEYRVSFAFDETVVLQPNYERKEDKRSGAHELVVLVEDSPERIVLQHLLVGRNGHVTKHWRQDWLWQAEQRLEFSADQTWILRQVPAAQREGAWTQCVYEVSDAPRYCGTGRWNHRYGSATWTSDRSWRPLPRREYTQREDYNALNVENRHTITPHGWTHEQDNSKVVRAADGSTEAVLVREFGFNDYRRIEGHDFGPAYRYWEATADYWARVRQEWSARVQAWGGIRLDTAVDGMPMIVGTFGQAARIEKGEQLNPASLVELFDRYVLPVSASTAGPRAAAGQANMAALPQPKRRCTEAAEPAARQAACE
ncbi:MAG: hypothetical protein MEQ07_00395 [Aquimonas sp.]|nr:hypothetical protein [Aquimonas sp.]